MTTIIGVDFSGAKAENKTWIAQGMLTGDGGLRMDSVRPITRAGLHKHLVAIQGQTVVAMDFPFGVPDEFSARLSSDERPHVDMRDLWETIGGMDDLKDFEKERDAFVRDHGEIRRVWEQKHHPESQSPLHKGGPNMIPMTYYGMKLLYQLHRESSQCWRIPPIDSGDPHPDVVILLETMPGAALKARGLSHQNYKGSTGRDPLRNLENRKKILEKLSRNFGIDLPNFCEYRDLFLFNDDALDAYIAAIVAALWAKSATSFHLPKKHDPTVLAAAKREGCIYVPR